jgi:ribosome-associated translation inhibitor RaiA
MNMKTQFHIRGLNFNANVRQRLEQPLIKLESLTPVSTAAVVVEYERDRTPSYRAYALLAVPGPDIHAEAWDHTLDAAWLKVTTGLRKQIEQRKSHQGARLKGNERLRSPSILRAGTAPAFRA